MSKHELATTKANYQGKCVKDTVCVIDVENVFLCSFTKETCKHNMSVCVRELEREYTVYMYVKECYDCYEINALKEYAKCLVSTGRQERNRQERNLRTQIDCATIRVVRLRPNLAASRG